MDNNLETAAEVWATVRTATDSPMDSITILCIVLYKVYQEANRNMTIEEYCDNLKETIVNWHRIQDIQGNA